MSEQLADFVVARNKDLEQKILTLQDEVAAVDQLETSNRYMRGLLENYIDMHTDGLKTAERVTASQQTVFVHLAAAVVAGALLYLSTDSAALMLLPLAWTVAVTLRHASVVWRTSAAFIRRTKLTTEANHLFPDILGPKSKLVTPQ